MKNPPILLNRILSLIGFLLFAIPLYAQTQLPECDADVPFFTFDLSGSPDTTFTTPQVERHGHCCGSTNSDLYLSFYATLHPEVAMFEIVVAPGYADPGGSGAYNIISGGDLTIPGACGTEIPGGDPVCISGSGPYKITYSKPGKNNIKYIFRQIPKPIFPQDDTTRVGCSLPLAIYGLNDITITSINSSTGNTSRGAYNSLLNCINCNNPSFSPGLATPAWIDYEICGTPQASICGTFTNCDTVRIYTTSALSSYVIPDPASFCSNESGVDLVGMASGGDTHYTYIWRNSLGDTLNMNDSLLVIAAGNYTLEIGDGLSSPTCANEFLSVPVTVGTLPTVNAGSDQTRCASNPNVYLNGSSSTGSGTWSGGAGTFSPSNNLVTAYTPTPTEISSGSLKLYLTATNVDAGCENVTDSLTVTFSPLVQVNPTATAILCHDGSTTISANASGGTAPYTYFWNTGSVNASITATAGTYNVTAYDQFGCSSTANTFIANPSPLTLSLSSSNTSTDISCDGSASVTVSGGTNSYSYLWSNAETSSTTTNTLCYGIYTVTVEDGNGCTINGSVVVNKPSCSSFNVTTTHTDVSCFEASNGAAQAHATGGTAPYTYSWNTTPLQTTQNISSITSGNYIVVVTDDLGCIDVANVTIAQPLLLTNSITYTNVSSIGGTDGSATANPSGGTPGYTYLWEPGSQTTATATNLSSAPGGITYHVTITDANACVIEDSVIINEPPCNNFYLGVNLSHVTCFGNTNGSAEVVIVDGTAPYDVLWSNGATTSSISNLAAGNYSVSVTDASNCTAIKTFSIGQPDPLSLGLVPTNVTCHSAGDGTVDLTVEGGSFPYSYTWYYGITAIADHEDLIDLTPGTYSVTVNDKNGCSMSESTGITQPTVLSAGSSSVDVTCYGTATGSVNASVSGGVLPYSYSWTGPSAFSSTTEDLSNLYSGLYHLMIQDANGCDHGPMNVFINQPSLLTVNATQITEVSCNGAQDGVINATPNGGTSPYLFAWTGPSGYTSTIEDPTGLYAGSYSITVTDDHLCTATTSLSVTTIADTTNPVISCHADTIVQTASSSCYYTQSGTAMNATATDDCQLISLTYVLTGATSGTGSSLSGIQFNKGITSITWTASDASGNTTTCSHEVTVNDSTQPSIISCGASGTVTALTDPGFCSYTHHGSSWIPTVSDNCSGSISLNYAISGATSGTGTSSLNNVEFNYGTSHVIWTATDNSGNTSTCSFDVLVDDHQSPIFTICGVTIDTSVVVEAGLCAYTQRDNSWNAAAVDLCTSTTFSYALSGVTSGTGTTLNGVSFNLGNTLVVWTASDQDGNTSTCSFNVIVTDTQDPIINCVLNQTVNVDAGQCNYTKTGTGWNAIATDNCTISTVLATLSGATTGTGLTSLANVDFNLGTTTVLWTVTDGSGNTSTCSFDVVVNDNILPAISSCGTAGNPSVNVDAGQCNYTNTGTDWDAFATDNCTVSIVIATLSGATTASGLTTLANVDFNLGTTTVLWTVTDGTGNTSTCSFDVVVNDNQLPTFSSCGLGGNQTATTDASQCTYQHQDDLWNAESSDLCSSTSLAYSLSGATSGVGTTLNGQVFNQGTTTITWTATDASGNTTTCSFNVTVEDVETPRFIACGTGSTITVPSTNGLCTFTQTSSIWNATANDNCGATVLHYDLSGATSGTGTSLAGQTFNHGTTTVTWTATDDSGNTVTCSFDVNVTDVQVPIISSCGGNTGYVVETSLGMCDYVQETNAWDAVATDNCGNVSISYQLSGATQGNGTTLSGVNFHLGTTTVMWTVSDDNGNTSTCSFTVLVNDIEVPVMSNCLSGESLQMSTDNGSCGFTQADTSLDPTVSDNCTISISSCTLSGATTGTYSSLSGVIFNTGTTNVNWIFTDQSQNSVSCSYTITVSDDEAPVLTGCPEDIYLNTASGLCGRYISWTAPEVSDNCQATIVSNIQPGSFFATGTTVVTYTATDSYGNQSTCSFTVTISDQEAPFISCNGDISSCDPHVNYSIPIASDNCGVATIVLKNGLPSGSIFPVGITVVTFEATDINGNKSQCSFNVVIHPTPAAYIAATDISCHGHNNGSADLTVTNGSSPYTYAWSNGQSSEDLANLAAGSYSVSIVDQFGCATSAQVTIQEPVAITMYADVQNVLCHEGISGAIDLSVSGGDGTYNYIWSDGQQTQDADSLSAGNYMVIVTDGKGCAASLTTSVYQPDTLVLQLTAFPATCAAANGSIQGAAVGGTPPYTYSWSNGQTGATLTDAAAGSYTLTVLDANNCMVHLRKTINSVSDLQVSAIVQDVSCFGEANASARLIPENAQPPFEISWSNGDNGISADSLIAGNYTAIFTDANGCNDTLELTVSQPDSLSAQWTLSQTIGGYNVSEFGACDGWIEVIPTGGTAEYSYLWSNGASENYVQGLCAGTYAIIITDANGCSISRSIEISEPLELEMPNGFSPNDDGDNDFFVVHGLDAYPDNELIIFNRWGNIVFQTDHYQNDWHGENSQSEPLPDATYFVILTVSIPGDGTTTLSGYVDLRRN